MTQQYPPNQFQQPQPRLPDPFSPAPHRKPRRWLPWAAGVAAFILGLVIGAAPSGTSTPSATSSPQPTVTKTVPGPAGATVPGPTVTKTVPGPVKTVTAAPPKAAATIDGDGTYEIGVDVVAGKYKSQGGDGCYWARLSSLDGSMDSIIANNISDGPQTVTIRKSDKGFETTRCGSWTKVG